jgi:hypothetical protein
LIERSLSVDVSVLATQFLAMSLAIHCASALLHQSHLVGQAWAREASSLQRVLHSVDPIFRDHLGLVDYRDYPSLPVSVKESVYLNPAQPFAAGFQMNLAFCPEVARDSSLMQKALFDPVIATAHDLVRV